MRVPTTATAAMLAAILAGPALAGGFGPPIQEPVVVQEEQQSRPPYEILLPLLVVGGLVATATPNGDTND